MVVGINTGGLHAPARQFTRIVNGRFFDCDQSGLRTRHIKWLDLIPGMSALAKQEIRNEPEFESWSRSRVASFHPPPETWHLIPDT